VNDKILQKSSTEFCKFNIPHLKTLLKFSIFALTTMSLIRLQNMRCVHMDKFKLALRRPCSPKPKNLFVNSVESFPTPPQMRILLYGEGV
jgi:hypothetical protein